MKTKNIKNKEVCYAVKSMREIRDQLNREIMNMTFAEEKTHLRNLLEEKDRSVPVLRGADTRTKMKKDPGKNQE